MHIIRTVNTTYLKYKYMGDVPSHWSRYVDDMWVKTKSHGIVPSMDHINSVDKNVKLTKKEMSEKLPFLCCAIKGGRRG